MKKKTMVLAYLIVLSLGTILSLYIPKNEVAAKDAIVIPGQAIRLRILANSDLESDQALKRKVRDAVNAKISVWVKDLTSIQKARQVIKSKLPEIQATAEEVVKKEGSKQSVHVEFGKVQFPTKLYGQFLYPAGSYEAILITLGKGEGANWWCVLFPPLCFLDFSNGIAVSKGFDEEKEAKAASKPEVQDKREPVKSEEQVTDQAVSVDSHKEVKDRADSQKEVKDRADSQKEVKDQADSHKEVEVQADSKKEAKVQETVQTASKTVIKEQASHVVAAKSQPKATESAKPKKKVLNRAEKEMQADEEAEQYAAAVKSAPAVKEEAPVYTSQDEEPVKVKFFVVELWNKVF